MMFALNWKHEEVKYNNKSSLIIKNTRVDRCSGVFYNSQIIHKKAISPSKKQLIIFLNKLKLIFACA